MIFLSLQAKQYDLVVDELGEIEFVSAMQMPGTGDRVSCLLVSMLLKSFPPVVGTLKGSVGSSSQLQ